MKKVLSAISSLVVAFMAYSVLGTPATSEAGSLRVRPALVRSQKVAWVQMNLPETKARKVRIEMHTPKVQGERRLWQFCDMPYVGLGTYRCGLDLRGSTPARSMSGKWLGKLKVDGRKVGTVRFRTRR
ncbi:MAG: hypothetical protein ACRDJL_09415 [Actinomycetota bacterium]